MIFSKWIRKRDPRCVTCGAPSTQAGHFIHRNSLDFDEQNVSGQCSQCNLYKSGNLIIYAIYLEAKYGSGIIQELEERSHRLAKYSRSDLENIIRKYS